MEKIVDKEQCVGCGTCSLVCPKDCILMEPDSEGFSYPRIDTSKCVDCGMCKKRCPVLNETPVRDVSSFWAKVKDKELLYNSSSGGAFSWMALNILQKGGVVFGARYDDKMCVHHAYIEKMDDLPVLQKSKYVQSDLRQTYCECRQFLEAGRDVLFVGTPCQVAGLKSFLTVEYEKLLTVDLICSGVGSPLVWKKYLEELQQESSSKAVDVNMRDKRKSWEKFNFTVKYEDGSEYSTKYSNDLYTKSYVKKLINRPSCYSCLFVKDKHSADFTIGDLWGIEEVLKEWDDDGNSVIIVNTDKAREFMEEYTPQLHCLPIDKDVVKKYNWPLERSASKHSKRTMFFRHLSQGKNVKEIMDKALRYTIVDRVKNKVKCIMQRK